MNTPLPSSHTSTASSLVRRSLRLKDAHTSPSPLNSPHTTPRRSRPRRPCTPSPKGRRKLPRSSAPLLSRTHLKAVAKAGVQKSLDGLRTAMHTSLEPLTLTEREALLMDMQLLDLVELLDAQADADSVDGSYQAAARAAVGDTNQIGDAEGKRKRISVEDAGMDVSENPMPKRARVDGGEQHGAVDVYFAISAPDPEGPYNIFVPRRVVELDRDDPNNCSFMATTGDVLPYTPGPQSVLRTTTRLPTPEPTPEPTVGPIPAPSPSPWYRFW